jgi:feruloyl-CoA synthase
MQTDPKHAPFRDVPFPETDIREYLAADGALLLRAAMSLGAYPERMTEGLLHWAAAAPDRVFMAQRDATGGWRKYTYGQTLEAVKSIAQALLNRGLTPETPVAILSENSIEHGLLAFAAPARRYSACARFAGLFAALHRLRQTAAVHRTAHAGVDLCGRRQKI